MESPRMLSRKQPVDRAMQHSFVGSAIPVLTLSAINLQAGTWGFEGKSTHLSFTGYKYFSSNIKLTSNYDEICRARAFYIILYPKSSW